MRTRPLRALAILLLVLLLSACGAEPSSLRRGQGESLAARPGESLEALLERHGYFEWQTPERVLAAVLERNDLDEPASAPLPAGTIVRAPFKKCLSDEKPRFERYCNGGWTRSLEFFDERAAPYRVEALLDSFLEVRAEEDIRVLELGMGVGRLLMQLRMKYPRIELHGVNKERRRFLANERHLLSTAKYFDILEEPVPGALELPRLHFFDATKGRLTEFESNTFDLVISQATIRYLERKDVVLEEIWRILRPGGVAIVQLSFFNVSDGDERLRFNEYLAILRGKGFDVHPVRAGTRFTYVRKNKSEPLDLGLRYVEQSSYWSDELQGKGWHSHYELLGSPDLHGELEGRAVSAEGS